MAERLDRWTTSIVMVVGLALTVGVLQLRAYARAAQQEAGLHTSDKQVIAAAQLAESRARELSAERARQHRRLFAGSERVVAEAAALRYLIEIAALSGLQLTGVQITPAQGRRSAQDRIRIAMNGTGEFAQVIEFLRLLQAPLHQIEQLRMTPGPAPNMHHVTVAGTVAFYALTGQEEVAR